MKTKKTIALMLALALVANLLGVMVMGQGASAAVKSMYVLTDHSADFDAFSIDATGLMSHQAQTPLTFQADASDVAVDESSLTLFVTFEAFAADGTIEMFDAQNLVSLGTVTITGTGDLAGIEADDANNVVYTLDRASNQLYVFDWDGTTLTQQAGSPVTLVSTVAGIGLALDEFNSVIYVTDVANGMIRGYDTTSIATLGGAPVWSHDMSNTNPPTDIAINRVTQKLYTTIPDGYCANDQSSMSGTGITEVDIATKTEIFQNVGHGTMGVAVDEDTGFVYFTTGCGTDGLESWDPSTSPWTQKDTNTANIGSSPAGLCIPQAAVSYNPLNLAKDDGLGGATVLPGQTYTYTISYDNVGNNNPVTGVVIVDTLPSEVSYVSNTGGGIYAAGPPETVTWNIGGLAANDPGGSVTVTVQVNAGVPPGTTITDICSIDSDQTGQAFADEDTLVDEGGGPGDIEVGGDVYPVHNIALLAPWMALAAILITGATIIVRRRQILS
jgi:uncharacterized repeat protein (TIGR01451 family)